MYVLLLKHFNQFSGNCLWNVTILISGWGNCYVRGREKGFSEVDQLLEAKGQGHGSVLPGAGFILLWASLLGEMSLGSEPLIAQWAPPFPSFYFFNSLKVAFCIVGSTSYILFLSTCGAQQYSVCPRRLPQSSGDFMGEHQHLTITCHSIYLTKGIAHSSDN